MTAEFQHINDRLDRIERISLIAAKNVLDLDEVCLLTGFSRGYLYRLTSNRQIPHFKKSRKLYFLKSEIEKWMLEQAVPTDEEINSQAQTISSLRKTVKP